MVRFVGPAALAAEVRRRRPEVVSTDGRPSAAGQVQAWVVGPGLGTDGLAESLLADVLACDVPVLVDADGLNLLARTGPVRRAAPTLLTPHAGELSRLVGVERPEVEAARLEHARAAASRYGAWVLLKGSTTVVLGPDSEPGYVNGTGSAVLATAGSGDVLSGLAGALLAAGLPVGEAGAVAAHLHGVAAREASGRSAPVAACTIAEHIPAAWRAVAAGRPGSAQ
jgi:hydroxyethylthiazole kinase-like uncharacterized protein yjeF